METVDPELRRSVWRADARRWLVDVRRAVTESELPDLSSEPIGSTRSRKPVENIGHVAYTAPHSLDDSAPLSVLDAAAKKGTAHAGHLLVVALPDWTPSDHEDAAVAHNRMSKWNDEHHEIFVQEYGDGGELEPAEREQFHQLLQTHKSAAQSHRLIADAHRSASAHLTSSYSKVRR